MSRRNSRRPQNLKASALFLAVLAALPLAAHAIDPASPMQVRVPNHAFDPLLEGEPALSLDQRFDGHEAGLRLVQFDGAIDDA